MDCRVMPYEGNEPYIFFSYCHENEEDVYPIIEMMGDKGYRIWYDDGIHPGEDWPEIIAEHLIKSTVCMAAITSEFAASHNCRNELTTAINSKKTLLPIVLGNFQMSLGLSMQLSSSQRIDRSEIRTEREFYSKLFSSSVLDICRGSVSLLERHGGISIDAERNIIQKQRYEAEEKKKISSAAESIKRDLSHEYRNVSKQDNISEAVPNQNNSYVSGCLSEDNSFKNAANPSMPQSNSNEIELGKNVGLNIGIVKEEHDNVNHDDSITEMEIVEGDTEIESLEDDTVSEKCDRNPQRTVYAVMLRKTDGKVFDLKLPKTRIGNDFNQCDVPIDTTDEIHAEIIYNNNVFLLLDRDSEQGTFLNGKRIEGMSAQRLENTDEICFGKEAFVFILGENNDDVETIIKGLLNTSSAIIVSLDDECIYKLSSDKTRIGSSARKCEIAFDNADVDYIHAEIFFNDGGFSIRDLGSDTGTFLNGHKLDGMIPETLNDKSEMRFGKKRCIFFEKDSASQLLTYKALTTLECLETNENIVVLNFPFKLGRHYQWPGGTFSDMHASRIYGSIDSEEGIFTFLSDKKASTNGIMLNNVELKPNERIVLKDGDVFKMGIRYTVVVHIIQLKIEGE